jgi:signal transduction histidine kinase
MRDPVPRRQAGGLPTIPTADISADAPARPSVDPGRHEWERFALAWHIGFGGLAVLTVALVAIDDGVDPTRRMVAFALTGALFLWYAGVGVVPGPRSPTPRLGPVYLIGATTLTLGLFAAAPVGSVMLFALYPHIWMVLPPRRAVVATIGVVAAVTAVALVRTGLHTPAVAGWLVVAAVTLAVGLLLGLWIARIIRQSQRRADLLAELAATRAELEALSREAGVRAERERLAHEIHDTLAQGFTSVLLLLEAAETTLATDPTAARGHLGRARETASANLAEARALVAALTPPDLTRTSLPEALRRIVERAAGDGLAEPVLSIVGSPRGLPTEHEVALLRTTQEALTNARRHAGAARVEVRLDYEPDRVSLRVTDDGCGFDPDAVRDGYGLAGMRSRAGRVGGTVSVTAAPGSGAAIRFDLPVGG